MNGQTTHLHLPQWVQTDYVLMSEFNAAFAAIDGYVDTVNAQLAAQEAYLASRIGVIGNNLLRSQMLERILGTYTGMQPQNAYLALLFAPANIAECAGFPVYYQNGSYVPPNGYPIGNPRDVPTIGLYSRTAVTTEDAFAATVRKTVTLPAPCSHLHCVLYATGTSGFQSILPENPPHMQYEWAQPWKWTPTLSEMSVSCSVGGVAATAAGTLDDTWPETFTYNANPYTAPVRQFSFDIDGSFTGSAVVDYAVSCGNQMAMHCLAMAVLMA